MHITLNPRRTRRLATFAAALAVGAGALVSSESSLASPASGCAYDRPCFTSASYTKTRKINLAWKATESFSHYNVIWSRPGKAPRQIQVGGGRSGAVQPQQHQREHDLRVLRPGLQHALPRVLEVLAVGAGSGSRRFAAAALSGWARARGADQGIHGRDVEARGAGSSCSSNYAPDRRLYDHDTRYVHQLGDRRRHRPS